jgi:predicted phage terminase large subunit-like protein
VVTLALDPEVAFRDAFARALTPRERRWASPLDMAQELDPRVVRTPALELINSALVDLAESREDRLMVSLGPQEGKSHLCSYRFPTWLLSDVDRDLRIIMISYSDQLARRWGADIKRDFETFNGTDATVDLGIRLRADSRAAGRWQVDGHRGGTVCAGVASGVTGRPAEVMIIDDPIKDLEQAQSPVYRERFQRFWQGVAVPRLAPGARVLLISTRWHEEDAAGWLLQTEGDKRHGGRWRVINIPAQCEDEATDPLGRKLGEYMQSARGDRDWEAIKKSVGSYVWAALYQGRPSPAEGGLFKRLSWRYWSQAPRIGPSERLYLGGRVTALESCWRFATVDLANSTRTSADYTVIAAWARTLEGDLVLLDLVRARIGEARHFEHAAPMVQRWQLDSIFVEASQYGTTLVREAANAGIPLTAVQAEHDKFSRALPYSAWVEQGRVWLPSNAHWLDDFLSEHSYFPAGRNDDTIDAGALACRVAITRAAPYRTGRPQPAPAEPEVDFDRIDF